MNSREKILSNIRKNSNKKIKKEPIEIDAIEFEDKIKAFSEALMRAGGEIVDSTQGFDIVLQAQFGVAENGACFINNQTDRKLFTYYPSIVIKLDKNTIFDNMHQAMEAISIDDFSLFMAGPSKTADIEQSLVIGAHGAKKVGVILL
ncbi:Predicted L-lactate dehydrogenase, hypothetical protein subunit SO1518 [hydrothermal vent metagenome]|uniref:LUD domain-containing protein n=1 Tax=hydrothermal vent metagenome TaxID=652676 RepID=A0A1W1BDZ5_9ZZZZ